MQNIKKILKVFVFFIPFVLGAIGFGVIEGEPLTDALFFSVGFYTLNNMDNVSNIFIEIARWTAPLMTAGGVILAVAVLKERFLNWSTFLRGESIAVYGSEEEAAPMLAQLGKQGIWIPDDEHFAKASRYILMGKENDNFLFYQKYGPQLSGKPVYLKCSSMNGRATGVNLNLFFEEEIAARIFWKKQNLYREAKEKGFRLSIVFLEFGVLEQQLLLWGLQNNIFHPGQEITYHIFGDADRFRAVYHELSKAEDSIIFHKESWYESLELLSSADRLMVSDAAETLNELLFAIPEICVDVLAANPEEVLHYENQERLRIFFWRQEAERVPNILEEKTLVRAKSMNLRYAHLYSGAEETKDNLETEWGKLDTFTKYSNISSADYHEVRLGMIEEWKKETGKDKPDDEYLMELAELEHIRWNRYHFLNNWKYGIPGNGKNKDAVKRIHRDLVSFSELTETEREKDLENIRVLLSIGES